MSYILDSLTKNDEKRRKQRPLATLLPQGNRTIEVNTKAKILTLIAFICAIALAAALIWNLWNGLHTQNSKNMVNDNSLIRQLELESSLAEQSNISIEESSDLAKDLSHPDAPALVTSLKNDIKEQSSFVTKTNTPAKKTQATQKPEGTNERTQESVSANNKQKTNVRKIPTQITESSGAPAKTISSQPKAKKDNNHVATTAAKPIEKTNTKNESINSDIPKDVKAPNLSALIYSQTPQKRFVMLDGVIYKEGDTTIENLSVVEIQKNRIILEKDGEKFYYARQ